MDKENDFYQALQAIEEEQKNMNKNLGMPSYRIFCNECDLPFHFWDELPEGSHDPEIDYKEMSLHREAMKLFSKLKPEVVFYKNNIIRYQLCHSYSLSWDGANSPNYSDYNKRPVNEYLEETSDKLFYLKNLEKRFETISACICLFLSFLVFCLVIFLVSYLVVYLSNKSMLEAYGIQWVTVVTGILAAVFFCRWLWKTILNIPRRILDDGRLEGVEKDLNSIRQKLDEIRGSRPNPLRNKRPGKIISGEWQPIISPMNIEKIHRIRAKLYSVAQGDVSEKVK